MNIGIITQPSFFSSAPIYRVHLNIQNMTTLTTSVYSISLPGDRMQFPAFAPTLTFCSTFLSLSGSLVLIFYMNCDLRPRPLSVFIVFGLTLTCGRWALSNGDMCAEALLVKR